MRTKINSIAETISNDWYRLQVRNMHSSYYLWHRTAKPGEQIAIPLISEDCPNDEYTLSSPERISPALTKQQAAYRINEIMLKLPILGV